MKRNSKSGPCQGDLGKAFRRGAGWALGDLPHSTHTAFGSVASSLDRK